jgi:outer membrane receptor protein involved in Fe transport
MHHIYRDKPLFIQFRQTLLVIFLLLSIFTFSQTGSLTGTITSLKTGETIPGVNVIINGTTIGASSDLDGNFSVNYIPVGTYNVIASFISYKSDTVSNVKIEKGKTTVLSFKMEEEVFILQGVNIIAKKQTGTDISMISTIKQSNLIVNGISAMQISRSQDKDVAEVIKRVPGVTIMDDRFVYVRGLSERYNSVWINNTPSPSTESDQRAFSFDVIPSNVIDNLLVFKTPAPELPSDFAGATIQITTKNVTEENKIDISYQAGFLGGTSLNGFYAYKGGKLDFLGFDDGTRKLPSIVPSTADMYTLQDYRDGTPAEVIAQRKADLTQIGRSFGETSTAQRMTAPIDNKLAFDMSLFFKTDKVRISNITSFYYKYSFFSDQVKRATYEVYDTINDQSVPIYDFTDDVYQKSVQWGGIHNWSFSTAKSVYEFRNLFNQIGASKMTYRNGIDYYRDANKVKSYELAYASRTMYSGQVDGHHSFNDESLKIDWTGGYSYAFKNEPDCRRIYTASTRIQNDEGEYEYLPYKLDYASTVNTESNGRIFTETLENIYTGSANLEYKLNIGSWIPIIKAGIYSENKYRNFDIRTFGISRAVVQSQFNSRILYQPIDSVYADTNFNFVNGVKLEENTAPEYSYNASTNLFAGYLALKIPFLNHFSLYGGVRIEKFRRFLGGFQSEQSEKPDIKHDTLDIYPSAILTYNISNKTLVRLSYGKTVNRPEYRELADYAFYDFEQSATVYGNPDLKDCYIKNLDLRFEYYPSPVDFLTFGLFYKYFDKPIEMNLFPASNGWDFVAVNSILARDYGAEIELRKSFASLKSETAFAGLVKKFMVTANFSYIYGRVEKADDYVRDKKRALYGQSPYVINAGIYYQDDVRGWSASVLFNMFGSRIVIVGTPTIPNVYEMPRALLDATISKRAGDHLTLKLGAKNLLDSPVIYRQTFDVIINNTEVERKQQIRRYSPGRSFYFTISYSF